MQLNELRQQGWPRYLFVFFTKGFNTILEFILRSFFGHVLCLEFLVNFRLITWLHTCIFEYMVRVYFSDFSFILFTSRSKGPAEIIPGGVSPIPTRWSTSEKCLALKVWVAGSPELFSQGFSGQKPILGLRGHHCLLGSCTTCLKPQLSRNYTRSTSEACDVADLLKPARNRVGASEHVQTCYEQSRHVYGGPHAAHEPCNLISGAGYI